MERIQVTVTEEAGKVLRQYQEKNKHKSKDDALNQFLLDHAEKS